MSAKAVGRVGLADAIDALREELTEALERGGGARMHFALEPIEMSVEVGVEVDVNGKIGWKVLELGGSYGRATTQRLTLKLTPLWKLRDGSSTRDFTVTDARPAGDAIGSRRHVDPAGDD